MSKFVKICRWYQYVVPGHYAYGQFTVCTRDTAESYAVQ
jgi:hypothetical protein